MTAFLTAQETTELKMGPGAIELLGLGAAIRQKRELLAEGLVVFRAGDDLEKGDQLFADLGI